MFIMETISSLNQIQRFLLSTFGVKMLLMKGHITKFLQERHVSYGMRQFYEISKFCRNFNSFCTLLCDVQCAISLPYRH